MRKLYGIVSVLAATILAVMFTGCTQETPNVLKSYTQTANTSGTDTNMGSYTTNETEVLTIYDDNTWNISLSLTQTYSQQNNLALNVNCEISGPVLNIEGNLEGNATITLRITTVSVSSSSSALKLQADSSTYNNTMNAINEQVKANLASGGIKEGVETTITIQNGKWVSEAEETIQ